MKRYRGCLVECFGGSAGTPLRVARRVPLFLLLFAGTIGGGRRVAAAGTAHSLAISRFRDGELDTDFGSPAGVSGAVSASLTQLDGKVVIAGKLGTLFGKPSSGVARFNRDGTLDTRFVTDPNVAGAAKSLALQSDGKLLVGGSVSRFNGRDSYDLVRLNPDGYGDLADLGHLVRFQPNGTPDENWPATTDFQLECPPAVLSDGGILIAGRFSNVNGQPRRILAKLMPDGTLDPTFARFTSQLEDALPTRILPLTNGPILLAGRLGNPSDGQTTTHFLGDGVVRLLANGRLDPTFECRTTDDFRWIRLLSDGKILCGGSKMYVGGAYRSGIARLLTNGSVDLSFKPDLNLDDPTGGILDGMDVDSSGRILVSGELLGADGQARIGIARLLGTPVSPANLPPQVALTSPGANQAFRFDEAIQLTANASDDQGVARVEFRDGAVVVATVTAPPCVVVIP